MSMKDDLLSKARECMSSEGTPEGKSDIDRVNTELNEKDRWIESIHKIASENEITEALNDMPSNINSLDDVWTDGCIEEFTWTILKSDITSTKLSTTTKYRVRFSNVSYMANKTVYSDGTVSYDIRYQNVKVDDDDVIKIIIDEIK